MKRRLGWVGLAVTSLVLSVCTPIQAPGPNQRGQGTGGASGTAAQEKADDADASGVADILSLPVPLRLGERVPDLELTTQGGATLNLRDLGGHALVLSFFVTRARDEDLDPALMRRLLYLQEDLRQDLRDRVRLVAVTVDPAHDTPEVLDAYGRALGVDPDRWILARPRAADLDTFAAHLGVVIWTEPDGSVAHTLNTVVIGPRGHLLDRFPGLSQWTEGDLLGALVAAAEQ